MYALPNGQGLNHVDAFYRNSVLDLLIFWGKFKGVKTPDILLNDNNGCWLPGLESVFNLSFVRIFSLSGKRYTL